MPRSAPARAAAVALALAAVVGGGWQRARSLERLPPDYDELVYLPSAYRYVRQLSAHGFGALPSMVEELGHPPLVKVLYAFAVAAAGAPEPDWKQVRAREPLPEPARPAFTAARRLSAAAGTLQLGVLAALSPLGALLLAFDPYHVKYTSLAMLEGVPGLLALVSAVLLHRALAAEGRRRVGLALLAAAALGAAAAGKYAYGIVLGLSFAPLVVLGFPRRPALWAAGALALGAAFFALAPNFWLDPLSGLGQAFAFHWGFSHGENVVQSGFPWWAPLWFLGHTELMSGDPGVFLTGATHLVLVPLAALAFPLAWRSRRIFAVWSLVGVAFLLAWSTKWPHYLLLVLPALAVCAGEAPGSLLWLARRARGALGRRA